MKRIIFCISLFAFFRSQAQQINPVPDYVFSNKMSVGRNAVTDTAAYFSIGPRYGAIRGMMPPMVTDTASMSATKRNGLLIFSIQKNKYLYWDSVGAKWAEMAGTAGSAITGSGVAGYMPEFTTATNIDTTRLYHSAGRFAIGSTTTTNGVFNVYGGRSYFDSTITVNAHISTINLSDKSNSQNNKIETQDNRFVFSVDTSNAVSDSRMIFAVDNSISMYLNAQEELIINADNEDRGDFKLQVILGSARIDNDIEVQANARLAQTSGAVSIGTTSTTGVLNVSKSSVNTVFDSKSATDARIEYHRAGSRRSLFNWDSNVAGFQQESGVNFYISGTETLIGTTTDAGAYALQVAGAIYNTTTITTGAPTSGSAKPWRLGEAATVSPTSPNRTIRVEIDGTVYYIHAKTTND